MAQRKQAREVRFVDVINVGGSPQKFEIVTGVDGVQSFEVAPGEIVKVQEGYTEYLERAPGRRKGLPILQQMAPFMRRVDELTDQQREALLGKRGGGRAAKAAE
jgi:hypothetical protein